jgi:hypothetical protein
MRKLENSELERKSIEAFKSRKNNYYRLERYSQFAHNIGWGMCPKTAVKNSL